MRYFTAELYGALQACESQAEACEANARWETAAEQYHARLTELRCSEGLRPLIELGSLHDSEVREIGTADGRRLILVLKQENRVGTLLLTYSLVDDPTVIYDVLLAEHRSIPRSWLYDELEREPGQEQQNPVFRHSILLSDGVELRLRFYRLEILEISPLLDSKPPARQGDVLSASA